MTFRKREITMRIEAQPNLPAADNMVVINVTVRAMNGADVVLEAQKLIALTCRSLEA